LLQANNRADYLDSTNYDIAGEQLSEIVADPNGIASQWDGSVVVDHPDTAELDTGEIVAGHIRD
jgi:hypothetical protein